MTTTDSLHRFGGRFWRKSLLTLLLAGGLFTLAIHASLQAADTAAPTTKTADISIDRADSNLAGYPRLIMGNEDFRVEVALADPDRGFYRGQRFDHLGIIPRVYTKNHVYFDRYQTIAHDPTLHDDIGGLAEEYAIQDPPGYAEAKPGEPFLKIGVGLLKKPDNDIYKFWVPYEVVQEPEYTMEVKPGGNELYLEQELKNEQWRYRLNKHIVVDPAKRTIKISRTLSYFGKQPIKLEHYSHNFMFFDGKPIGPGYTLDMRGKVTLDKEDAFPMTSLAADGEFSFLKPMVGQAGGTFKFLGNGRNFDFTVAHKDGASVRIIQSRPASKFQLWMTERALCPEPFTEIDLPTGQYMSWDSTYQFAE